MPGSARTSTARAVSVVFWSAHALDSDPVKTEADEAKRQGKLLPVQIDTTLDMRKLPLGHDRMQFTSMASWGGDTTDPAWRALVEQIEQMATPPWVLRRLAEKEAELRTERRRAEMAVAAQEAAEAEVARLLAAEQHLKRKIQSAAEQHTRPRQAGYDATTPKPTSNSAERVGEPSWEEVLASIRKMISKEPPVGKR